MTIVALGWCSRTNSHIFSTLTRFGMMAVMPMTSYWRVRISSTKRSSVGKVQHRARGLDVGLDQHDAPTAVKHPQREGALGPRHLVVIQLHRVHLPAAVLVILAIGPEDAGEEHFGLRAQRVDGLFCGGMTFVVLF